MLFLTNEQAKKAEINILTARDTKRPGYLAVGQVFSGNGFMITGTGNTVRAQRLSKKKELLQLVNLDLNPPNKQAGLVPVRLGELNN